MAASIFLLLLLLYSPCGKHKGKYFLLSSLLCPTWGFHKSSKCPFPGTTKHLSIPPSPWPVSGTATGAPPLGSPLRKAPAEQTRRGRSTRQIHAVSCIRGSFSLQTYTKKRFPLHSSSSEIHFFHLCSLLWITFCPSFLMVPVSVFCTMNIYIF